MVGYTRSRERGLGGFTCAHDQRWWTGVPKSVFSECISGLERSSMVRWRSKERILVIFGSSTAEHGPPAFQSAYFPSEFGGSRDPGWSSGYAFHRALFRDSEIRTVEALPLAY